MTTKKRAPRSFIGIDGDTLAKRLTRVYHAYAGRHGGISQKEYGHVIGLALRDLASDLARSPAASMALLKNANERLPTFPKESPNQVAVGQWLRSRSIPDLYTLVAIARTVNADPGWLVFGAYSNATPMKDLEFEVPHKTPPMDAKHSTKYDGPPVKRPKSA